MKRTNLPQYLRIGSISTGTLKVEDILEELIWALGGVKLSKTDRRIVKDAAKNLEKYNDQDEEPEDGGPEVGEVGVTIEDLDEDYEILGRIADEHCPPFCYFGSHEGDGADIGVWVSDDAIEVGIFDGEILCESDNGFKSTFRCGGRTTHDKQENVEEKGWRYKLVVSDHGNMELRYRNGQEVWGVV